MTVHWLATLVAFWLLLVATLLWRDRCVRETGSDELGRTTFFASALVVLCAVGAAVTRVWTGEGEGEAGTALLVLNVGGLAVLAAMALAATNLLYQEKLGSPPRQPQGDSRPRRTLTAAVLRFVQRQRLNLIVVLLLTVLLTVVGDTSGQAIDSIRTWSPIPGSEGEISSAGLGRLFMGLATALLLALALYESALRLTQAKSGSDTEAPKLLLQALCGIGVVAGALLWLVIDFGPGLFLAGALLGLILLLELPHDLTGRVEPTESPELTRAELRAPEWLAIAPLLALATTSLAATIDAALSGGVSWDAAVIGVPALVLAAFAVLMTAEELPPRLVPTTLPQAAVVVGGLVVAGLILIAAGSTDYAAGFGGVWLVVLVGYAGWLFRANTKGTAPALATPLALGAGAALLAAVHFEPLEAGRTLGVLALANVGLAFAVVVSFYLVQATLRYRPPKLLWWFGFQQLPVLTFVFLWWVAVGAVDSDTLHDVRIVDRRHVEAAGGKDLIPPKPRLADAFASWAAAQPELREDTPGRPVPLVLVAAQGGGIRAAYWTAVALDCIVGVSAEGTDPDALKTAGDEERQRTCEGRRRTETEQRAVAGRIFLASGVSGGAVGLYAYLRQLLHNGQLGDGSWVDQRLAPDFASPAVAWALFHDIPNRLLGLRPARGGDCRAEVGSVCWTNDRAAVLEDAFDGAWDVPATEALLRRVYDLRFADEPTARNNALLIPVLVANASLTGGHTRAIASAVDLGAWPRADEAARKPRNDPLPLAGAIEITDSLCGRNDMRLSTAAVIAARFPYVTPSAHLQGRCGGTDAEPPQDEPSATCAKIAAAKCEGSFVDGGYLENSGLFSIIAIWPSLRAEIAKYNAAHVRKIALLLVELDNHYQATVSATVPSGGTRGESLIPLQTAFGGRSAMQTYARAAARRLLPESCMATVSPSLHPGLIAPLGWELSPSAREDLREGLIRPHPAAEEEQRNDQIVRLRLLQERLAGEDEPRAGMEPVDEEGTPLIEGCVRG